MRRLARIAIISGAVLVAVAGLLVLLFAVPATRAGMISLALRVLVWSQGYHFSGGDVSFADQRLTIRNLRIADDHREPFLDARGVVISIDPKGIFGRSDRWYGLRAIAVDRPHFHLLRRVDGKWNFERLIPPAGPPNAAPTRHKLGRPLRLRITVARGAIDFVDPQSAVRIGRSFSITGLESAIAIDRGARSTGRLSGILRTSQGDVPLRADLFEDDPVSFGRMSVEVDGLPLAPIVDTFVPSVGFAMEAGTADVRMESYAAGYGPDTTPKWHAFGHVTVQGARVRALPLAVPIRDIRCDLHLASGLLSMHHVRGEISGIPIRAQGALTLVGPTRLIFGVVQRGRLEQARHMFAFLKRQDLAGPFSANVRISGLLTDVHVDGAVQMTNARYAQATLRNVQSSFHYSGGHVAMSLIDLAFGGARMWAQGDLDVASPLIQTQAIVSGALPVEQIPLAANLVPHATVKGVVALDGPIANPSGDGYAQVTGAQNSLRMFFGADSTAVKLGPALYQRNGGEALLWASRTQDPTRTVSAEIVASHLPLVVKSGRATLADVAGASVALPSLDTTLDGEAFLFGNPGISDVAVDLRASNLVYQGVNLGAAALVAAGRDGAVRVARATLSGPAASISAKGYVVLGQHAKLTSTELQGSAAADLGSLAPAFGRIRPRGSTSGTFAVVYAGGDWTVGAQARSADASIAGVPLRNSAAFIAKSKLATSLLANVSMPGGALWAVGTLPSRVAKSGAHVDAILPRFNLAELGSLARGHTKGTATGFAAWRGSSSSPDVRAAATLRGSYGADPYDADLDVRYASNAIHSYASRVAFEGNQATIDGNVSGIAPGRSTSHAALGFDVRIREGDLVALNRFVAKPVPVSGSFNAEAHLRGVVAQPQIEGYLDTDLGTIRGVAFDELRGSVRMRGGSVQLRNASVDLGTSEFALDADASRRAFHIAAKSPHVDMSDFNDFFGGSDVFAGTGSFDINVGSEGHGLDAHGRAALDDAALRDFALGHIATEFSSSRGALAGMVSQAGPAGTSQLAGTMLFRSAPSGFPDFGNASYRVSARLRNLQVDEVLPFIHEENLGLVGRLDADGTMIGTVRKPTGSATFVLHDGYLRRVQIKSFSATVAADENRVTLSGGMLELPFLSAQGSGHFDFARHAIGGHAALQVTNLAGLAKNLRIPGTMRGTARAVLSVSGTLERPKASAEVDAVNTRLYDVAFEEAKLRAQYAPGEISIGDSALTFAGKGGKLSVAGNLPVQLRPFALGPKERPINLSVSAQGMDLSALDPLTSRFATLTGNLNAQATLSGTAGNPVGKGTARIRDASVRSPSQTVPLTNGSADLSFENDTITLHRLHASAGSGSLDLQGAAHIVPAVGLRTYAGLQLSSRLAMHGAQVDVPNWVSGTLDGQLSFTRSGVTPYLAGDVSISNATMPFAAIIALAQGGAIAPVPQQPPGVPVLEPGHTIVYGGGPWGPLSHTLTTIGQPAPAPTGIVLPSLNLNVALSAKNNVRIRGGSDVDLTTTGALVIAGNLQAPTLRGQFQAVRGQVGYFDTTFRLVSGTVTFDPREGLLPTLNAIAVTNISGEEITLNVTGRVDNLNTQLSANPAMSRDEIIATLLHTPIVASLTNSGSTPGQSTLVQTAQNYFNAQLSRSLLYPVESALAQELNIESISLIFNQYGNLAVEVRTRFSPWVSAVYQSSLSVPVTSAYGMSYRLQDYLALDVLQSSQPDYGLYNTVFNFRYTFR